MDIRCATCFVQTKTRSAFSKPKGWIKYKAPDGNAFHFCSQECIEKFIFPAKLKERSRWIGWITPRKAVGVPSVFKERAKGFMLSPTETFNSVKYDDWGGSVRYYIKLLLIFIMLETVVYAFNVMTMEFGMLVGMLASAMMMGILIVTSIPAGIIGLLVGSLWLHIWVYVVGGRGGVKQTIKSMAYGNTPALLLGWILLGIARAESVASIIGMVILILAAAIWSWIAIIVGIRQLHEISTGRAVAAVLGAITPPAIILLIMLINLVAMGVLVL